jgi:hypothetical protein
MTLAMSLTRGAPYLQRGNQPRMSASMHAIRDVLICTWLTLFGDAGDRPLSRVLQCTTDRARHRGNPYGTRGRLHCRATSTSPRSTHARQTSSSVRRLYHDWIRRTEAGEYKPVPRDTGVQYIRSTEAEQLEHARNTSRAVSWRAFISKRSRGAKETLGDWRSRTSERRP